jgi:hypothetical protein
VGGLQTNNRRRLGVSPGPVALKGPVMVTDTTEGKAPRFRPGGRKGDSGSASLRSTNATPTLRGPAATEKRKPPWPGPLSPVGTPGRRETFVIALRSPSMLISS